MKNEKEIAKIEKCIGDLLYEKVSLKKAYNYYHGIRDAEQFRHIESNYGIGSPTSVGFTPLIKKHIDVLVGEYLELDQNLEVSCIDEDTLSYINRDKQLAANKAVYEYLGKYLRNAIMDIFSKDNQQPSNDPFIEKELQKIVGELDKSFVSEYEKAGQNIIDYIKHSRDIDLKNKLRDLFTDLLISGVCYYRTKPSKNKQNLDLEILNPLDTFIERNRNEYYLNKSPRCVIRRWLTEEQILNEFGDELSKDAKSELKDYGSRENRNYNTVFVRAPKEVEFSGVRMANSTGILGGLEATPIFPWDDSGNYSYNGQPVISVLECEWTEYENGVLTRHEGVKIGDTIYITRGSVEESTDGDINLTLNGIFFQDKNGQPFSMELSTMHLQD